MAGAASGAALRHLRDLFGAESVVGQGDGQLLARFSGSRDEAAFEALVARHGPMVLGTCRAILGDEHAAEDAFQATFLVLARKARSIRGGHALGGWLHRVARRAAVEAGMAARKRRRKEAEAAAMAASGAASPGPEDDQESGDILRQEVGRLPESQRLPVVLCDLGGLTYEQAAGQLRWTVPTLRGRLAKARQRLRSRLTRRGVTATAVRAGMVPAVPSASVPASLIRSTVLAATGGPASSGATLLAHTLLRGMLMTQLKIAATAALAALALASAGVLAAGAGRPDDPKPAPTSKAGAKAAGGRGRPAAEEPPAMVEIKGQVLDPEGRPVPGATVVAGCYDAGKAGHQVFESDAEGRFTWTPPAGSEQVCLLAHKDGFAPWVLAAPARAIVAPGDLKARLARPEPFAATLVDGQGKPVAGARVRVEMAAFASEKADDRGGSVISMGFTRFPREVVEGSPVERLFVAATGVDGSFAFRAPAPGSGLKLAVTAADGRVLRVMPGPAAAGLLRRNLQDQGYVVAPPGEVTRLVAVPGARIAGRVVSTLPGVGVSGLTAGYQPSHVPGAYRPDGNSGAEVRTDAEGRFAFDGLGEGTVNVFVHGKGENDAWTYRAAKDVELAPGATPGVTLELIRGVEVVGTVTAQGTGKPVAGAQVGVYGPFRPRSGAMTTSARTDDRGRYRYRLPSGETYFYVMGPPDDFARLPGEGSSRTVTIPEGTPSFEVPPIELAAAVTVRGRVLDAAGVPIAAATVVGTCEGGVCRAFEGAGVMTDARGEFRLPPGRGNTVAIGRPARLLIRLPGGAEHEAAAVPAEDGAVTVKVPVGGRLPKDVAGPRDVAPDELAGVVVDAEGSPIRGAEVDAWTWYPGHEAVTDAQGAFRIGGLDKGRKVEVAVRKPGYTPQLFPMRPAGEAGWVIVLGDKTYFEGRVAGPDGAPVADALIRANNGPKQADGVMISEIWTEARTGGDGRYRMYAQADVYDIQVRVPGVGVARLADTSLGVDEAKRLDIPLERGVTFRANVVDSLTGDPVPGVRLWHWQHPGIEGRSGRDGLAAIADMLPGRFAFQVEAPGYARWWSGEAATGWGRRQVDPDRGGWRRNFDSIDFDLRAGQPPVTIAVERGVAVSGRVLDPDGTPVAGATVAPALTGTGNSLTGDTRFSVETGPDGAFSAILPAGGGREYNLVAHDGQYGQWRTWANGVLPPFRTKPGESYRDVELRLTRPATVRGRVADAQGLPVPGREVRASAADRRDNRYYDPTSKTAEDGTYELKFIRDGEHLIQVAPFWLDALQAPAGTSRALTLTPGESRGGVDFQVSGRDGN